MDVAPLAIRDIVKSYQGRCVLRAVSLALKPGEIFGLVGLNGAGKTTLIKNILNLVRPDSGTIELFGRPAGEPRARRHLSYLPEKFQPSRYLRGHEFLKLSLSYFGKPYSHDQARSLVESLDLDPRVLEARVGSYSKGMGQKLGLAGALLVETPLIILDEPMSGLDPRARIRLKAELLRVRGAGRTVFFSSHILSDLDEVCDRIGILHEGTLLFTGAPRAFKESACPGDTLEQAFLRAIEAPQAA